MIDELKTGLARTIHNSAWVTPFDESPEIERALALQQAHDALAYFYRFHAQSLLTRSDDDGLVEAMQKSWNDAMTCAHPDWFKYPRERRALIGMRAALSVYRALTQEGGK